MRPLEYASAEDMKVWARSRMQRAPDFIIGDPDKPYMRRWWVIPRNELCNVYLHEILRSDDDRALHDHPWPNTSMLIDGRYVEHTPEGSFMREAGWVGDRAADAAHRLEILPGERAVSLFMTGPKVRDWAFTVRRAGFTGAISPVVSMGRSSGEAAVKPDLFAPKSAKPI